MPDVTVVDHPAAALQLAALRDARTGPDAFRAAARRLGVHLATAALQDVPLVDREVTTPLTTTTARVPEHPVVAIPVLRAGLGLLDGVAEAVPNLQVGMIGLARDEDTKEPTQYYRNVPDLSGCTVLLLKPMLATGGSAAAAVAQLEAEGAVSVQVLSVVATEGAIARIDAARPGGVRVVVGAVDPELDQNAYIVPGLGDFGDRLFGTT